MDFSSGRMIAGKTHYMVEFAPSRSIIVGVKIKSEIRVSSERYRCCKRYMHLSVSDIYLFNYLFSFFYGGGGCGWTLICRASPKKAINERGRGFAHKFI